MATNSSQNLGLHLWEPDDQVLRTEFNENWQKIDTAVSTAQQTAETQCKAGTYTGDGKTMAEGGNLIQTGFPPKFVIVSRGWTNTTRPSSYLALVGEKTVSGMEEYLTLTATGFKVGVGSSSFVTLNESGQEYSYLAVR